MATAPKPPRTAPKTAPSGRGSTTRKPDQAGSVLPVTNPMDLWYLCQKAGYAEAFPLRNKKGWPMYQRTVTQWVHRDNDNMKQAWPYYGEVGFDMYAPGGPVPIMSKTEPMRPSRMPLSGYDLIRDEIALGRYYRLGLNDPLVPKQDLEAKLSPEDMRAVHGLVAVDAEALDKKGKIRVPGALRIPDVIRVHNFMLHRGKTAFTPENIAYVIEMKFEGDVLSRPQEIDYRTIGGGPGHEDKLRLLETKVCRVQKSGERAWLEEARRTEPVFESVEGKVTAAPRRRYNALSETVGEYALLVDAIEAEHEAVRELVKRPATPPASKPGVPELRPWDVEANRQAARQNERVRAALELVIAGPMGAGAVTAVAAAPTVLLASGLEFGEGVTVLAQGGVKLVQFPPGSIAMTEAEAATYVLALLKRIGVSAGAATATAAATASPSASSSTSPGQAQSRPPSGFILFYIAD